METHVRLIRPASAIYMHDGKSACLQLLSGTVIEVLGLRTDLNGLADVQANGRKLVMFIQDIRDSSESDRQLRSGDKR
jgi:hypothetical protein